MPRLRAIEISQATSLPRTESNIFAFVHAFTNVSCNTSCASSALERMRRRRAYRVDEWRSQSCSNAAISPWATAGSSELGSKLVSIAAIIARRESYVAPRWVDLLFRGVFRFGEVDVGPRSHLRARPFSGIAAGPSGRLLVHPMSGRAAVPESFVFHMLARIVGHGGGFYRK